MSSYDKVVKLACKPKAAPPKAKYLDPIIAATWDEGGAVGDVCKALSPRFKEPNSIVVFKALIVLHTMIRSGSTDNVLSYLSTSGEILRLHNVSVGASWEGYKTPENLQNYAQYLEARIKAYGDLKHDAVKVQSDNNRDHRNSTAIALEDDSHPKKRGRKESKPRSPAPMTRSKTVMGRKLRVMTVEKGLLRETKVVQRMISKLVECRFYLDDLDDELTITALIMLVKDLLILFQAGNEGVINVLEHYFEMSHVDATDALALYRHFCTQTERVVEFLGVAKKLENLLHVSVPNLKHAPVSLAGALQEYLDDPLFEQNRIEYQASKAVADRGGRHQTTGSTSKKDSTPIPPVPQAPPAAAASTSSPPPKKDNQAIVDFFSSIEEQQPTLFNPQTHSPTNAYFQQQAAAPNPFIQHMMTGQPFVAQPTGFVMPQQTAFQVAPPNPFGALQAQQTGHRPFSSFIQPQTTGFPAGFPMQPQPQQPQQSPPPQGMMQQPTGFPQGLQQQQQQQQPASFLRPQTTGGPNPFRQSMLFPQATGMAMFGGNAPALPNFQSISQPSSAGPGSPAFSASSNFNQSPTVPGAFGQPPSFAFNVPPRPASTPLTSPLASSHSPPVAQPVKTHLTGSKNPFGLPQSELPPPVPKPPTMMEIAMGYGSSTQQNGNNSNQPSPTSQPGQNGTNGFTPSFASLNNVGPTDISGIASTFSMPNGKSGTSTTNNAFSPSNAFSSSALSSQNTSTTSSGLSDLTFGSSSLQSQPTGATTFSSASSLSPSLNPQTTGYAGIKAFKPTSSFGAALLESLPPIPGSAPGTPGVTGGVTSPIGSAAAPTSAPATQFNMNGNASGNLMNGLNTNGAGSFGAFSGQSGSLTSQPTGMATFGNTPFSNGSSAFGTQPTGFAGSAFGVGNTVGVGLRPQMTGGAANPFRASMAAGAMTGGGGGGMMPEFDPSKLGNNFGGGAFGGGASSGSFSAPNSANVPSFGFGVSGGGQNPGQSQGTQQQSLI